MAAISLAAVYICSWLAPAVGLYHDDGVYLVTAKALAEGRGYQIISLPHAIPQTKYPFLFPAALSVIWRVAPHFPANVPALKALPLACAITWFVLAYGLLRRKGATTIQALWMVLLSAAAPSVVYFSTSLLSETMFAMLFTATLLAASEVERSRSDRLAWATGCLAALAFLTRTAGVALLAGIPLAFAIRRRFGAAWRFLVSGGAIASIWSLWVYAHASAADPTQFYYSWKNYASWNILANYDLPQKLKVLFSNSLVLLISPALLLEIPVKVWLALLLLALVLVALLAGRVAADSIHLSITVYIGLILCWAWPPTRFVSVILPIVFLFMWKAVETITPMRLARAVAIVAVALVSLSVVAGDLRRIPQTAAAGVFRAGTAPPDNWFELKKIYSWLKLNAGQNAVILANLDPSVYLFTGHKATRDIAVNSYDLFYSGRPIGDAPKFPLDELVAATGASYLVVTPDKDFAETPFIRESIAGYVREHPGKLARIDRPGSDPDYAIYRLKP